MHRQACLGPPVAQAACWKGPGGCCATGRRRGSRLPLVGRRLAFEDLVVDVLWTETAQGD